MQNTMEWLDLSLIFPMVIGWAVMFGSTHALTAMDAPLRRRVVLGWVLLVCSVLCMVHLVTMGDALSQQPWLLGLTAGALGLGINQATAAWRVARGGEA